MDKRAYTDVNFCLTFERNRRNEYTHMCDRRQTRTQHIYMGLFLGDHVCPRTRARRNNEREWKIYTHKHCVHECRHPLSMCVQHFGCMCRGILFAAGLTWLVHMLIFHNDSYHHRWLRYFPQTQNRTTTTSCCIFPSSYKRHQTE